MSGGKGGWDWSRISVAGLAVVSLAAGTQLVTVTDNGTTHAGYAMLILGSVLAGAWIATMPRDRGPRG